MNKQHFFREIWDLVKDSSLSTERLIGLLRWHMKQIETFRAFEQGLAHKKAYRNSDYLKTIADNIGFKGQIGVLLTTIPKKNLSYSHRDLEDDLMFVLLKLWLMRSLLSQSRSELTTLIFLKESLSNEG